MRKAEKVMDEFMEVWLNMEKYQNISLKTCLNPEILIHAFHEEKKIVKTYEVPSEKPEIEEKQLLLVKKEE